MFKFQSLKKKKILPTPKEERLCLVKVTHKTHDTGQEEEGQDAIKEQVPFIKEIAALPRSTRSSVLQTQREGTFLRKPQKCVMGRNAQLPSSELGSCCSNTVSSAAPASLGPKPTRPRVLPRGTVRTLHPERKGLAQDGVGQ